MTRGKAKHIMSQVETLAAAWWPVFNTQWVSVKHLIRTAYRVDDPSSDALRGVLRNLAPSDTMPGSVSSHKLGRFLVQSAGICVSVNPNRMATFVERGSDRGAKLWQLTPVIGAESGELLLDQVA